MSVPSCRLNETAKAGMDSLCRPNADFAVFYSEEIFMNRRSQIFSAYNKLKSRTRKAGQDTKRVDRALGLSLSGRASPYLSTPYSCNCPDAMYRGIVCKHQLRRRIMTPRKKAANYQLKLPF
jgi:hypothetical protein